MHCYVTVTRVLSMTFVSLFEVRHSAKSSFSKFKVAVCGFRAIFDFHLVVCPVSARGDHGPDCADSALG